MIDRWNGTIEIDFSKLDSCTPQHMDETGVSANVATNFAIAESFVWDSNVSTCQRVRTLKLLLMVRNSWSSRAMGRPLAKCNESRINLNKKIVLVIWVSFAAKLHMGRFHDSYNPPLRALHRVLIIVVYYFCYRTRSIISHGSTRGQACHRWK